MASQRRDGKRPAGVADDVVHLLETAWVFSAPGGAFKKFQGFNSVEAITGPRERGRWCVDHGMSCS